MTVPIYCQNIYARAADSRAGAFSGSYDIVRSEIHLILQIGDQLVDLHALLLHGVAVADGNGAVLRESKSNVMQYGVPISS